MKASARPMNVRTAGGRICMQSTTKSIQTANLPSESFSLSKLSKTQLSVANQNFSILNKDSASRVNRSNLPLAQKVTHDKMLSEAVSSQEMRSVLKSKMISDYGGVRAFSEMIKNQNLSLNVQPMKTVDISPPEQEFKVDYGFSGLANHLPHIQNSKSTLPRLST